MNTQHEDPFTQAMDQKAELAEQGHPQKDELSADQQETAELPQGLQAQGEEGTQAQEGQEAQGPGPDEEGIELDGQTFRSQEEAFQYLKKQNEKLQTDYTVAEAYRQGLEAGRFSPVQGQTAGQLPKEEEPEFDLEKFYANPEEYLKERDQKIERRLEERFEGKTQEQQLWNEFYTKNPDLSDDQDLVALELEKHNEQIKLIAQTKGKDEAMKYLATKARGRFQNYWDRAKPQRELPRTHQGPSSAPNQRPRVTHETKKTEPIDFPSQINKLRAKRAPRY